MQPMPPQQPYPQHAPMQPAMPMGPSVAVAAREPKRNLVLMAIGAFLLLIGFLVFCLFAYNLWQYLTVEDRFTTLPSYARAFAVEIVQKAAMKRMMVFGPVSGFFGLVGLVLAGLGLRKK